MADKEASTFPNLSNVPVYRSFFEDHESYERYHIHLIGAEPLENDEGKAAIDKRRNCFGTPRVVDAIADPFVKVTTVGEDTGSTDYFPIGQHTFAVLEDSSTPLWDAKCMLIGKKESTEGLKFTLLDKNSKASDEVLMEFTLERSEMPEATPLKDSTWMEFRMQDSGGDKRLKNMVLVFRIMVTDGSDRVVTQEELRAFHQDFDNIEYTEEIVADDTEDLEDNALLQCWRRADGAATKAVLWVLGRNDVFMHSHVAQTLFLNNNFDLYVLNYKQNGRCRERGWVPDAHFNSHNKYGDFNAYLHDIAGALEHIGPNNYELMLGYAHSTGAPILLNYLMERGDEAFDGFIFNSPFLDWGFVGGDMVEFVLKHVGMLETMGAMKNDTKFGVATTPEAFADTPIAYLKEDIVLCDWAAKFWSLYYWDWPMRPLYKVPVTAGFAAGVTGVHSKLESYAKQGKAVTSKPFLCITSRGDDVLKANETLSRADWIGPGRWEVELNDNGHDIFLSQDEGDTDMAIGLVQVWMKGMKFSS